MRKLMLTCAAAALISTGAIAQSTIVTTTTGASHAAAVQIEPEYRTKIRTYLTEQKVRPVQTREQIVVGQPVPREVELEAVPADGGSRSPSIAMSTRANA